MPQSCYAALLCLTAAAVLPARSAHAGWTEKIVREFGARAYSQPHALSSDSAGNLWGVTFDARNARGRGYVIKLPPPQHGQTKRALAALDGWITTARGGAPNGPVLIDGHGNIFGTSATGGTFNSGLVFEIFAPNSADPDYSYGVLYNFPVPASGVDTPGTGLISDPAGNLYGTTTGDGTNNFGTVYELSPPTSAASSWTRTILYSFHGADGSFPSNVIADSAGNLYGTTLTSCVNTSTGCAGAAPNGLVFELVKPATPGGAWTENILVQLTQATGIHPDGGLVFDAQGNLYGTTQGNYVSVVSRPAPNGYGNVFQLTPPATATSAWGFNILYQFSGPDGIDPHGSLIFDGAGNLYGYTNYGGSNNAGTVYELSPQAPPATLWSQSNLFNFTTTNGAAPSGLTFDANGNLYGSALVGPPGTSKYGLVFQLVP